jgi:hypothetical protein
LYLHIAISLNSANCNLVFIAKKDIKVAGKSIREVPVDIPSDEGVEKDVGFCCE